MNRTTKEVFRYRLKLSILQNVDYQFDSILKTFKLYKDSSLVQDNLTLQIPVGHFHLGNLKSRDPLKGVMVSDISKAKDVIDIVDFVVNKILE